MTGIILLGFAIVQANPFIDTVVIPFLISLQIANANKHPYFVEHFLPGGSAA